MTRSRTTLLACAILAIGVALLSSTGAPARTLQVRTLGAAQFATDDGTAMAGPAKARPKHHHKHRRRHKRIRHLPALAFRTTTPKVIRFHHRYALLLRKVSVRRSPAPEVEVQCFVKRRRCPRTSHHLIRVRSEKGGRYEIEGINYVLTSGSLFEVVAAGPGVLGRYVSFSIHRSRSGWHARKHQGCLLSIGKVAPSCTVTTTAPTTGGSNGTSGTGGSGGSTGGSGGSSGGSGGSSGASGNGYVAPVSVPNYQMDVALTGSGTVTGSGIACGNTCSSTQPSGTVITLKAAAATGWSFHGWGGACTGTSTTCSFVLTAKASVTASFTIDQETLTINRSGPGQGSVSGSGISCGGTCSVTVPYGTVITISPSAPWDVSFGAWQGGGCAGTGSCTITMTANDTVGAPFSGYNETAGGNIYSVWTNPYSGSGTQGPAIGAGATVQVSCYVTGLRVSDGNTYWYRIASSPWNNNFFTSADPYYNNGQTGGALSGTPFIDGNVPHC